MLRILKLSLGLLLGIYILSNLLVPPQFGYDCSYGWMTWKAMQKGAPFHHTFKVDESDISRDVFEPLPFWSPGQYLLPALLLKMGFSMLHSITILTSLAAILGLIGFYFLFLEFGFSPEVSLISILVISLARIFSNAFVVYEGGEILFFGMMPWLMLISLKIKDHLGWKAMAMLAVAGWVGIFLKFTAELVLLATYSSMIMVRVLRKPGFLKGFLENWKWILMLGGLWLFDYVACSIIFPHPMYSTGMVIPKLKSLMLIVAGPFMSIMALDSFLARVLMHPSHVLVDLEHSAIGFPVLAVISVGFYVFLFKRFLQNRVYVIWLGCFILVFFSMFAFLFSFKWHVGEEVRHFRAVGYLMLPGFICMILESKRFVVKALSWGFIAVLGIYGFSSFFVHLRMNQVSPRLSSLGTSLRPATREILSWLHETDGRLSKGNNLYFIQETELNFDVKNGRATFSNLQLSPIDDRPIRYHGKVDHLFVILQPEARFQPRQRIDDMLNWFVDYKDWKETDVGGFLVFTPVGQEAF